VAAGILLETYGCEDRDAIGVNHAIRLIVSIANLVFLSPKLAKDGAACDQFIAGAADVMRAFLDRSAANKACVDKTTAELAGTLNGQLLERRMTVGLSPWFLEENDEAEESPAMAEMNNIIGWLDDNFDTFGTVLSYNAIKWPGLTFTQPTRLPKTNFSPTMSSERNSFLYGTKTKMFTQTLRPILGS
jgi:hypothetical protein